MKSVNEVRIQINGLVNGIRECNFIPYVEKQDIVQNTWVKIIQKMNEGVIVDDAKEIKGYVFQVLRNFCLAYHRDKNKISTVPIKWELPEDDDTSYKELKDKQKEIIEHKILAVKYRKKQKDYIKYIMDNQSKEFILENLDMTSDELKKFRQGLVLQLKADLKRPVKYMIRNENNSSFRIPCFTSGDIKAFFKDMPIRRVKYMIFDGYITEDGYYVETLIKRKRKGSPQ